MNRQRSRRSVVGVNRARRTRPAHAASRLNRISRPRAASPTADEAALAFLSEILIGERDWTMAEVQHLIAMRESADRGRWRVAGLDDEASAE